MTRIISIVGGLQPTAPTIGTATAGDTTASVAFTASSYIGKGTITYTATSSPGGLTATGASSPLTVTGLTNGTAYTFTVVGNTNYGVASVASAASNSITPASATAYQSISTVNVTSAVASINFTSIPATYTHLQIRGIVRVSTVAEIRMQFNGDTGSNYSWHEMASTGVIRNANNGTNVPRISIAYWNGFPSTASYFGPLVLDILDYTNTNKYKTTRAISGYDANGTGGVTFGSGNWRNTSAITDITLFNDSSYTFEQYSQFALYGIKGA